MTIQHIAGVTNIKILKIHQSFRISVYNSEILQKHRILELEMTSFTLICKIRPSYRISVSNPERVLQPAESAFLADSALLSNAPANHMEECHCYCCLY